MLKSRTGITIVLVLLGITGLGVILIMALPYSLLPIALGLVSGGIYAWKRGTEVWLRALGVTSLFSGFAVALTTIIVGYLVFGGQGVRQVIPIITPVSTREFIVVDNRSPYEKTQVSDGRLRCTANPVGLVVTSNIKPQVVKSTNAFSETIHIEGKGLVPDEPLNIFLREGSTNPPRSFAYNTQVNSDGTFSETEFVPWDSPQTEWQVFVVHQRGVACVQFLGN